MTFYNLTPQAATIPEPPKRTFMDSLADAAGQYMDRRRDQTQWKQAVDAFPENPNGFSREAMFALGRNPELRPYAIQMLTGRMTPAGIEDTKR